ncbi:DUF2520 domain-containing protein [Pedobacter sp. Du54]|uniref:Rossmann-like and DUF2520 domain-containing protein n=1 Tax=Pedobacter anseongensis TaxID=3133439 RepID=UPI00309D8B10
MKAVLVGSGNVATHLALALKAAEIEVVQIWSKHVENSKQLAEQIGSTVIAHLSEIDQNAHFCIVSIKDDAIPSILNELKGFKGVILHTSGTVNLGVFGDDFNKYGVLYPLQTFSKQKHVNFRTIPVCIEANGLETLKLIRQLAEKLSDTVVEVVSEKRKILHVAAVFACNFTNHLYALAEDLVTEYNLDFKLLRPLILETAAKVEFSSPKDVQTGPAIRGDEQTIRKHEELLLKQPQLLTIYQTLSESIKKTKK